ncbi:MAG: hypothetical protein H7Z43_15090 [Clostridia bacterium]|nr:hypothetical protein [Deltaproteobacteria bacterium]
MGLDAEHGKLVTVMADKIRPPSPVPDTVPSGMPHTVPTVTPDAVPDTLSDTSSHSAVLEIASSNRSKCRACGTQLEKGVLRFGERAPNPFGDGGGELTYWFHPDCAAYRRSEIFVKLTPEDLAEVPEGGKLMERAQTGVSHRRVPRIAGLEHSKSGRAKCRQCKEAIATSTLRILLTWWEEGRMAAMGFLHLGCATAYFETREIMPWLRFTAHDETHANAEEIMRALGVPL